MPRCRFRQLAVLLSCMTAAFAGHAHAQLDPTGDEQAMLELLNRIRMDPAAELGLLVDSLDPIHSPFPDVNSALQFFGVDGNLLADQWSDLAPAPPVAWNESLYNAALGHNQVMIQWDQQSHQVKVENPASPGEYLFVEDSFVTRITDAGYTGYSIAGENIYAYASSVIYGHAGFAIDWGYGPGGIQDPPGHRDNMMDSRYREVGIAITEEGEPVTGVGPLVITQDFGSRSALNGSSYLLGVIYNDADAEGDYDAGEGLGGAAVMVRDSENTFTTQSMTAGGYQLLLSPDTYDVFIYSDALGGLAAFGDVILGEENLKLDATVADVGFFAGDLDIDGQISFLEAATVVANIGMTDADWFTGDFNADGMVDVLDAQAALGHLPAGEAAALQPALSMHTTAPVPEPAAIALLSVSALILMGRRRSLRRGGRPARLRSAGPTRVARGQEEPRRARPSEHL